MSRRARALAFLLLALTAAAAAAAIADGYRAKIAHGYGPLRAVVVVESRLRGGTRLGPEEVEDSLGLRRIPERFVPPGALSAPLQALGSMPRGPLPAGSYLLASQLTAARARPASGSRVGRGRHAVEIAVSGAGALLAAGAVSPGTRVDVAVTSEPGGPGPGRTYVAAADVALLGLRPGPEGPGGTATATLALTRREALRLISAESFARRVTVLAGG